jgi:hypothetical protein
VAALAGPHQLNGARASALARIRSHLLTSAHELECENSDTDPEQDRHDECADK